MQRLPYVGPRPGGAGVQAPLLQGGASLGAAASSLSCQLTNNDPVGPSAVQLTFDPAYLEADADTQDDGTVAAPCYVVEPGGTRSVPLVRSGTCPDSGGPYTVTVTATLPGGGVVVETISVSPQADVPGLLTALSPTRLYDFQSVAPVVGSGNLVLLSGASLVAPQDGSGFLGELELAGTSQEAYFLAVANDMNRSSGQDRSVVWAGRLRAGNGTNHRITDCATLNRYLASLGMTSGANLQVGNDGGDPNDYNTHLPGTTTAQGPYLICMAWDSSADELVISSLGPSDGGTFVQTTHVIGAQVSDANNRFYYLGGGTGPSALSNHGAYAVFDSFIDAPVDLAGVAGVMGIGS